ncbi:ferredoxin--NADP reductase [Ornithinimicrobium avium]|nr:FAD-binding oxidoreductase [Ornithinimicrobium avium]
MRASWDTYDHRVERLRAVSPVVHELVLTPTRRPMPYRSGQYVMLDVQQPWAPERAYSLADAPRRDGRVRLLVTRYPAGPTSGWVHDGMREGDQASLTGPFGTMTLGARQEGPVLLLAAGSGLAPLEALAQTLVTEQPHRPVVLCFAGRTRADALDGDRLEELAGAHWQLRYLCVLTREPDAPLHGRLPAMLGDLVGRLAGWEVFVAGREGFVRDCRAAALALGAAPAMVRTEEFFADPAPRPAGRVLAQGVADGAA